MLEGCFEKAFWKEKTSEVNIENGGFISSMTMSTLSEENF